MKRQKKTLGFAARRPGRLEREEEMAARAKCSVCGYVLPWPVTEAGVPLCLVCWGEARRAQREQP